MSMEMKRLKKEGTVVQSLSRVQLFETPWTGARQAPGPYSTGKFPRAEGIAAGTSLPLDTSPPPARRGADRCQDRSLGNRK